MSGDTTCWPMHLTEVQRRYLEALIQMDVAQIAADIASAETGGRPIDAIHLRLAHAEAVSMQALVELPAAPRGPLGID